jgi:hypothetical protein
MKAKLDQVGHRLFPPKSYPDADAMRMIALSTLGADDEPSLEVVADGPAHNAKILTSMP